VTDTNQTSNVRSVPSNDSRELLEFSRSTVDEVAATVGQDDARGFRRVFLKIVGLTPSDYCRRFPGSAEKRSRSSDLDRIEGSLVFRTSTFANSTLWKSRAAIGGFCCRSRLKAAANNDSLRLTRSTVGTGHDGSVGAGSRTAVLFVLP